MAVSRIWRHRARVAEAMVLLVSATAVRRVVPMPRWSRVLGEPLSVSELPFDPREPAMSQFPSSFGERRIALAVRSAERRLPYDPRCLDSATAGQIMMRRRSNPGIVIIGLLGAGAEGQSRRAHAWLVGESGGVTGGSEAQDYAPVSCFVPPARS